MYGAFERNVALFTIFNCETEICTASRRLPTSPAGLQPAWNTQHIHGSARARSSSPPSARHLTKCTSAPCHHLSGAPCSTSGYPLSNPRSTTSFSRRSSQNGAPTSLTASRPAPGTASSSFRAYQPSSPKSSHIPTPGTLPASI